MSKIDKIESWMDSGGEPKAKRKKEKKKPDSSLAGELRIDAREKKGKAERFSSAGNIARIQQLLKEAPDSPEFLGKYKPISTDPKKSGGFFKKKKYQDLARLRADLNTLTQDGKVDVHSRQKVRNDIKKYPEVPDLHVINAVYTYQDTPRMDDKKAISKQAQDKLNEHQLDQLKKAIHEIVLAFHYGGLSVFNINWFMKIYIDYLNVYKGRLSYEYQNILRNKDKESLTLKRKLSAKQTEIIEMLDVKSRFGALSKLGVKLNGTTYLSDAFSAMELRKASAAFKTSEVSKVIVEERRAGKIIFVYLTMLTLLAKVPILKHLVADALNQIPDEDRGISLRKRMVVTLMKVSDFEIAMASGNKENARTAAREMYKYCKETIKTRLINQIMREIYEVDAYLKFVWIIKSSDTLFERKTYKDMLKEAYDTIKIVTGELNQLQEKKREMIVDLANKYTYQLDTIMDNHGWIGEAESRSWQNRPD